MDPVTDETCDLPPEGWHCDLPKGHDGACPTIADEPPADPKPPRSGNVLLLVLVSLCLIVGMGLTALQIVSQRRDASDRRSDLITACRGDFSVKYVTGPNADVNAHRSDLTQIQAAGLEGTTDDDGRSATVADSSSPYDGMTLAQLRPLSAKARSDLTDAQADADAKLDIFRDLSRLAKNDPDQFLIECKEQLS